MFKSPISWDNYFMQACNTDTGKNSFNFMGPKLWQGVPEHIKSMPLQRFKYKYKNHLINAYSFWGITLFIVWYKYFRFSVLFKNVLRCLFMFEVCFHGITFVCSFQMCFNYCVDFCAALKCHGGYYICLQQRILFCTMEMWSEQNPGFYCSMTSVLSWALDQMVQHWKLLSICVVFLSVCVPFGRSNKLNWIELSSLIL